MVADARVGGESAPKVALLNNPKVRGGIFQFVLVIVIAYLVYAGISNMSANLAAAGISRGFGFLSNESGFTISFSLIDYDSSSSTYLDVFFVGLANTLLIAFLGIIFATIIGFSVGVARLSNNWMISKLATVYIEAIRNIPLLLQLFIWYFGVLRLLPQARDSFEFGALGLLNNRGYFAPKPIWADGASLIVWALLAGIIAAFVIARWAKKRQMATGQPFPSFLTGLGLIIFLPIIAYFIAGQPLSWDLPQMGRFKPDGGVTIPPEFIAMLLALTMYTAAFIAEIVRAGILAINDGQSEAAHALGLRHGPTLRLVIIPQALRVIIPPLTSQYLNLTKNSSLAIAIAYPELTSVFAGTALNQAGQAVEILAMTMLTYLFISIVTSLFMNWYNSRMALVER